MKYLTYDQLKSFNNSSIRNKRNRNFVWKELSEFIEEHHKFPVVETMIHNDREMRLRIALGFEGQSGYLDVSFKQYNQLQEITHDADGVPLGDTKETDLN